MNVRLAYDEWAHKRRVARDFGAAAAGYDRVARLQRKVIRLLADQMPEDRGGQLLDLGSGTGLALPVLRERAPAARIMAVDLAEGMVRHARQHQTGQAHWLVGDAESLPLADASLDAVFSSLMIQWAECPGRVFAEIHRVLRPGGVALVSTLLDGTLEELRQSWRAVDPRGEHVNRFLTREELAGTVRPFFPRFSLQTRVIALDYGSVLALFRELKGLGARYKAGGAGGHVTGPGRIRALEKVYGERFGGAEAVIPASYHVGLLVLRKGEG